MRGGRDCLFSSKDTLLAKYEVVVVVALLIHFIQDTYT